MSAALAVKRHLLAKIESTYATDPTPVVGSNAMIVKNLQGPSPVSLSYASRQGIALQSFGRLSSKTAFTWREVSFDVEVGGASAAGTAPPYGPLLRACGLAETIVPSTSVTYAPISAALESVTLYGNRDGMQYKMTGCRGSVSLAFDAEQIPVYRFRFIGLYAVATDTAMSALTLSAWQTPKPMNKTNTTSISLHSYACGLWSAQIDLANVLNYVPFPGGSEQVFITDREPSASATIEYPTMAQKDFDSIVVSGATGSFTFVHGSGAGTILTVTAAQARLTNPRDGDVKGVRTYSVDMELAPTLALNNELSLAYT
jgi:hypothetical protein